MKRLSLYVIGLLVAVTMTVAACGGGNEKQNKADSPKAVQERFIGHVIKGNYDKAVEMTKEAEDATAEEKAQTAAFLQSFIEAFAGGITSYEAVEEQYNDDSTVCTVVGHYTYGDGTAKDSRDKLVKTDRGWVCTL